MSKSWSMKNQMDVDEVWDDTELIKMYEESIQENIPKVTEKKFKGEDGVEYTWKVGGKCMAPFTEDDQTEYYAATIDWIGGAKNQQVGVTFLYYGNQATVDIRELWENEEAIEEAVQMEKQEKKTTSTDSTKTTTSSSSNASIPLPSFAPPVPPNIIGMVPASEREALSSMLMSWYMSGYHTGYYQAIADRREGGSKQ
uniref:Tudor domain-containing protein n=1 Tax=Caenorhabditis japonica TaxID=281687 RepID=A0A8R1HNB8_CAEJA